MTHYLPVKLRPDLRNDMTMTIQMFIILLIGSAMIGTILASLRSIKP